MVDLYQLGHCYGRDWIDYEFEGDHIKEWRKIDNLPSFRKALVMANRPLFCPSEDLQIEDDDEGTLYEAAVYGAWGRLQELRS